MLSNVKRTLLTLIGAFFVFIGIIFILLPGPAVLFLPAGLALLSLEYPWAKLWLRRAQRLLRQAAVNLDLLFSKIALWLRKS